MDDPKSEKVALFRYGLIATLVLEQLSRGELMRRARELAALHYDIPFSERTTISVATLLKWARRYRKGGLDALNPKRRKDRGVNRVISPQLAQLIERLKRENPHRTGTTLLPATVCAGSLWGVVRSALGSLPDPTRESLGRGISAPSP